MEKERLKFLIDKYKACSNAEQRAIVVLHAHTEMSALEFIAYIDICLSWLEFLSPMNGDGYVNDETFP